MNYENGSAFRRALEDRLRTESTQSGMALMRLRKMVAFDRYLARLVKDQSRQWILKGGLALQLRLGAVSRTTKDLDMLLLDNGLDIHLALQQAGAVDLEDWFSFEVGKAQAGPDEPGGKRYPMRAILDSRPFESFHIDIGVNDLLVEPPVLLITPGLLTFAGIQPTIIPCYPVSQQIAEKFHAYTRLHTSGESSRVKDFVDMLLMAALVEIQADILRQALAATFSKRRTHPLPIYLPLPPRNWEAPYRKLAGESRIEYVTLWDAFSALQKFFDPLLAGHPVRSWIPTNWAWRMR
jgi:hypothetical protein